MGTTARGLRYPEPEDRLNQGQLAIRNLAEDVNARIPQPRETAAAVTASSGWSVASSRGYRVLLGNSSYLYQWTVELNRTGGTVGPPGANTGNITDVTLCQLPTGWTPGYIVPIFLQAVAVGPCSGAIGGTGSVVLQEMSPTSSIPTGEAIRFSVCYYA